MRSRFAVAVGLCLLAACGGGGGGGGGDDRPSGIGLEDLDLDGNIYVIAFGDSITRGQGDGPRASFIPPVGVAGYPARLRTLAGVPVANYGIPGEQTSEGVERLGRILSSNPADYVILLEGVNDLLPERDVDTIGNLRSMVEQVLAADALPILATLTPTCCDHAFVAPLERVQRVNGEIVQLAATIGLELTAATGTTVEIPVIDFFSAFMPAGAPPIDDSSGLIYEEGLHLTPAGYDRMALAAYIAFFGEPPPGATPLPTPVPTPRS